MKKFYSLLAVASFITMGIAISSCDSKAKLARDIDGTWASTTTNKITVADELSATVISMYQFDPAEEVSNPTGGKCYLAMIVNVNGMMPQSDGIVEPYTYAATALSSVAGEWSVIDDDEIAVAFTDSTFTVRVDPSGVLLQDNILTGENTPVLDSIKPAFASKLQERIYASLKDIVFGITKIDDIEIKGDDMKCEILDQDRYFHRQVPATESEME